MKTREIKIVVAKSPRPHFLISETVVVSKDAKMLTGKVHFPSSDVTIGDRGHVNVAHSLLALWNCAYVLAFPLFKGEKKKLRVTRYSGEAPHPTPPDQDIDVACTAVFNKKDERRGTFNAEFSLNGKVLQKVSVEFIAC